MDHDELCKMLIAFGPDKVAQIAEVPVQEVWHMIRKRKQFTRRVLNAVNVVRETRYYLRGSRATRLESNG